MSLCLVSPKNSDCARRRSSLLLCAVFLFSGAGYAQDAAAPDTYRTFALKHDGNVGRGREVFSKAACVLCHTVDGKGGRAGPDLFAVGDTTGRGEIINAILEPSATIAVGYGATIVEMKSGETFYGIIKEANAQSTALMGADGKLVQFATADIKEQRGSPVSLMPQGLHSALSVQEFTDLIDYLTSLKQPENSLTSNRGMPNVIPILAKPVVLRPVFEEALRFPATFVHKPGDVRSGLVWFVQVPGSPDVFLAIRQSGEIWRLEKTAAGYAKSLFGDFKTEVYSQRGPNGLLGLAFHPQFRDNRKYYLKHQVLEEGKIATVLVEKRAAPDIRSDSGEASRRLLKILSVTENHSGGCIQFGPDGFLYLGMGDTGPQQDPNGHGQDLGVLLGKMLRIDVDHQESDLPYAIPRDNPFRDQPGARPEIWAWGFREPWRFSFDTETNDLWVGDVGQDRVEEVGIVRRGENHGWNVYEGFESFSNRRRREGQVYVPPVMAYKRKFGNSVTGGYVYRGDKTSSFYGVYVFGDYTSHLIWGLTQENRTLKAIRQIGTSREGIASFATDERGRIYVVGYEGMVYEIDFASGVFEPAPSGAARAVTLVR
jgi:putative heme-binding domain-containing protein